MKLLERCETNMQTEQEIEKWGNEIFAKRFTFVDSSNNEYKAPRSSAQSKALARWMH